jgi:hypothetical protein
LIDFREVSFPANSNLLIQGNLPQAIMIPRDLGFGVAKIQGKKKTAFGGPG